MMSLVTSLSETGVNRGNLRRVESTEFGKVEEGKEERITDILLER